MSAYAPHSPDSLYRLVLSATENEELAERVKTRAVEKIIEQRTGVPFNEH